MDDTALSFSFVVEDDDAIDHMEDDKADADSIYSDEEEEPGLMDNERSPTVQREELIFDNEIQLQLDLALATANGQLTTFAYGREPLVIYMFPPHVAKQQKQEFASIARLIREETWSNVTNAMPRYLEVFAGAAGYLASALRTGNTRDRKDCVGAASMAAVAAAEYTYGLKNMATWADRSRRRKSKTIYGRDRIRLRNPYSGGVPVGACDRQAGAVDCNEDNAYVPSDEDEAVRRGAPPLLAYYKSTYCPIHKPEGAIRTTGSAGIDPPKCKVITMQRIQMGKAVYHNHTYWHTDEYLCGREGPPLKRFRKSTSTTEIPLHPGYLAAPPPLFPCVAIPLRNTGPTTKFKWSWIYNARSKEDWERITEAVSRGPDQPPLTILDSTCAVIRRFNFKGIDGTLEEPSAYLCAGLRTCPGCPSEEKYALPSRGFIDRGIAERSVLNYLTSSGCDVQGDRKKSRPSRKRASATSHSMTDDTTQDQEKKQRMQDEVSPTCSICCSRFIHSQIIRELRCGHQFHRLCIDTFLLMDSTCPTCHQVAFTTLSM